jgi:hypothetical protein
VTLSKQKPRRVLLIAVMLSVVLSGLILFFSAVRRPSHLEDLGSTISYRDTVVEAGGISRPSSDIASKFPVKKGGEVYRPDPNAKSFYFGEVRRIEKTANPATVAIADAISAGSAPSRLAPMFLPKPFVLSDYQQNPTAYLEVHEPGRVFQSAQPAPGVPVIEAASMLDHVLKQGEAVRLSVKVPADSPATFASFDIGTFDNGLAAITVAADDSGVATASFNASPGKVGEVNILAASPVASERIHFTVFISPKSTN